MPPEFTKNFATAETAPQKKPPVSKRRVRSSVDLRYILSIIVFACTLVALGAAYGVAYYLEREIQTTEDRIIQQEEALQPRTLQNLILFNSQIEAYKMLEQSRTVYLTLLTVFSSIIVPEVRYQQATLSLEGERALVRIEATASTLPAYLQQLDVLKRQDGLLRDVVVGEYFVRRDSLGRDTVTFTLTFSVSLSELV